jgi:hypothetical protein
MHLSELRSDAQGGALCHYFGRPFFSHPNTVEAP